MPVDTPADPRSAVARRLLGLAAALVLALGLGVAIGRGGAADGPSRTAVLVTAAEVDVVAAAVVAHTWGTEVLLDLDDTVTGERYDVVVVALGGAQLAAGSFVGDADRTVDVAMNAAVAPGEVVGVTVVDGAGRVVVSATVPEGFGADRPVPGPDAPTA